MLTRSVRKSPPLNQLAKRRERAEANNGQLRVVGLSGDGRSLHITVETAEPEPAKQAEPEQERGERQGEEEAEPKQEAESEGEEEGESEEESEQERKASEKARQPLVIPDEPLSVVSIDPGKRAVMTTCQGAPPSFRVCRLNRPQRCTTPSLTWPSSSASRDNTAASGSS